MALVQIYFLNDNNINMGRNNQYRNVMWELETDMEPLIKIFNGNGLYFWSSDMIIVENISEHIIREVVFDLFHSGELYTSFSKII